MAIIQLKENIKNCYLRGVPLQVKDIETQHKRELDKYLRVVKPGETFEVKREVRRHGNFFMFELAKPIAQEPFWWIFGPNFLLPQYNSAVPPQPAKDLPAKVHLKVKFLSQRDNRRNPGGGCNVTCVATTLVYFGHPAVNAAGEQLEDELYSYCERNGLSRHSPQDLATLIRRYGYQDVFKQYAKWNEVKTHLIAGNPCIVHSYLVAPFGHIVTIIGYNEKGWIVHDPWGEWHSWGYDTSTSGADLTYSYQLMDQVCSPDGDLWIHFVSR